MVKSDPFRQSLAVMIGIDAYQSVPPLRNAVSDALAIGRLLQQEHGYQVLYCLNEEATLARLRALLELLPQQLGSEDRLLLYFAGHGVTEESSPPAPGSESFDEGPQGYLIPQDAAPGNAQTFLAMHDMYRRMCRLACRHCLLILDCCFAGAFRWSGRRGASGTRRRRLYRERYERYVRESAWQVLTSAAHDERALDVLDGRVIGARLGSGTVHSPFAAALLRALSGAADENGDGIMLASDLYGYVESHFATLEQKAERPFQRPALSTLRIRDKSEYFFFNPQTPPKLESAVRLNAAHNPYRGLQEYRKSDHELFFGRDQLVAELLQRVQSSWLIVVLGSSGVGKSSLVQAGLLHRLDLELPPRSRIIGPLRPGGSPLTALKLALSHAEGGLSAAGNRALAERLRTFAAQGPGPVLLVVDQFEELVTLCHNDPERRLFQRLLTDLIADQVLRVILTLRSDFEPQFAGDALQPFWAGARFVVPLPGRDELRRIIEGPAELKVLHFEPPELVERLVSAVHQMPGALPLLSFTLSELYIRRLQRAADDRALTAADYDSLDGVIGSLQHRIEALYLALPMHSTDARPTQAHMRRLMLRLVSIQGGERTRRRIPLSELEFGDERENARLRALREALLDARLLVQGQDDSDGGAAYIEPAHDALVCGWSRLSDWLHEEQEQLLFQRRLTQAAAEWTRGQGPLWDADPRLNLARSLTAEPGRCNAAESGFIGASDRRRRRQRRLLVSAVAAAFLAISTAAGIAWLQRQAAVEQRKVAEQKRREADDQRNVAERRRREADEQTKLAVKFAGERDIAAQKADNSTQQAQRNERRAQAQEQIAKEAQADALREARQARDLNRLRVAQEHLAADPTAAWLYAMEIEQPDERWQELVAQIAKKPLCIAVLSGHAGKVVDARFSPDGRWIVTAGYDRTARLYPRSGEGPLPPPVRHGGWVTTAAFSPDGTYVATGADDGSIGWFRRSQPERAAVRKRHESMVNVLTFSPDGRYLATAALDGEVRLWRVGPELSLLRRLQGHGSEVWAVTFSPDNRHVITAGKDGTIRRWAVDTGGWIDTLPGVPRGQVRTVAFSSQGRYLAAALLDGEAREWDMSGTPQQSGEYFSAQTQRVDAVLFGPPDSTRESGTLLALTPEGLRTAWRDGSRAAHLFTAVKGATSFELSADGRYLAASAIEPDRKVAVVLPLEDGQPGPPRSLIGHTGAIRSIHLSQADDDKPGLYAVTAAVDGTARVWSLQPPKLPARRSLTKPLLEELKRFSSVCLSTEQYLAIVGDERQAEQLWRSCEQHHGRPVAPAEQNRNQTAQAARTRL